MLLRYRDPHFWKKFHDDYWKPRVPTVLRQPFKDFPFTEASVVRALKTVNDGLRRNDRKIRYVVSVGDKEKAPRRRLEELVRRKGETMAHVERNCALAFKKQSFGVMLHEMQRLDPEIWSGVTSFLQDAREWIDFPVPRAFLDLFMGNYARSFVGLHKDSQEIFAFVLREKKRMLAWPFEYFERVEQLKPGARYFQMRLPVDYREHREHAIVLDADPGDVIYWPDDYWHIAEAEPGRFSAMLSLGLVRQDDLLPKTHSPFRDRLLTMRSQDMTDVVTRDDAARQLRWATGFGFELGGPVTKMARGKTVTKNASSLLLWKVSPDRRRIVVAANGHSHSFTYSADLVSLLERLAAGETVPAGSRLVDWLRRIHAV